MRNRLAVAAAFLAVVLAVPAVARAAGEYVVKGMVLKVDTASRTFVVSHERIEGLMGAMTMPFDVRDGKELDGVRPGAMVEFSLVVDESAAYATRIRVRRYASVEQDPRAARRLALLDRISRGVPRSTVEAGQPAPDFALTDQAGQTVRLSSLAGKVVALTFVYTRCALPHFCLRVANNFGVLQKRFAAELERGDLVLLTITFDPARDTPEVLASYASRWDADPASWHFLTGAVSDVKRVTRMFGLDAFPDEGLMNHSLRTAVIDRRGRLAANIEGNQFTPEQLGDLVLSVLNEQERVP